MKQTNKQTNKQKTKKASWLTNEGKSFSFNFYLNILLELLPQANELACAADTSCFTRLAHLTFNKCELISLIFYVYRLVHFMKSTHNNVNVTSKNSFSFNWL